MNGMTVKMNLLTGGAVTGAVQTCQFPGRYCFAVNGTFGGATVGLEMLGPDGTNYIPIEDDGGAIAITSAKSLAVLLPAGSYRATVSGGSGAALYASLSRVTD